MADLLAALTLAATKTPDQEGRDIILSMLVVGLVFLAVIAVGELARYVVHRRRR